MEVQIELWDFLKIEKKYSEETELKKLAEGSPKALENIYEQYSTSVFRAAYRYLRKKDITQDLVQEVFVKVWENRQQFVTVDNFRAYLLTISKNLALKYLKEIAKEETAKNEWREFITVETEENKNTSDHKKQLYQDVKEAVSLLPEQQQKVFRMAKFEGLSYKSISEHLHISPNTVRNHMVSANRFIRDHMENKSIIISFAVLTILIFS